MTADRDRDLDAAFQEAGQGARPTGLARRVIRIWALFGGFVLVGLVLLTAASAMSDLLLGRPFAGTFELVRHGVAIAAFAFLPYAQLTHANVTVDIFTEGMGPRAKAAMLLFSSLIATFVAGLLLRQMWFGMLDYIKYPTYMVSVPIPLWTAFPPALISLALLVVASLITAGEGARSVRA